MRAEDNATKKKSPTSSRFRVRKEGSWREDTSAPAGRLLRKAIRGLTLVVGPSRLDG